MTTSRRWSRALALGLFVGTVACSAAVPTAPIPTAKPTPGATAARPSAPPAPAVEATPGGTATAQASPRSALREEIDIGTIDPEHAPYLGAFASDGASVWFASGLDDRLPGTYAPDLWRFVPGADGSELVWKNPGRERSISVIAGDLGTVAFAEMDGNADRDWNLWLLPEPDAEPILLDTHPRDENVSSLLPSVAVSEGRVAWTAFDRGPRGPVSQLRVAAAPDWTSFVLEERDAATSELWLPSLRGTEIVYCELTYNTQRTHDVRHVYLSDTVAGAERQQLDSSGRATMPLLVDNGVVWKETEPGFSMFNWGRLVYWDRSVERRVSISSGVQTEVNNPSAGTRFVAVFPYDTGRLQVYDLERRRWRLIQRYDVAAGQGVYRAHVAGDLLVWLETNAETGESGELRWAYLPLAGEDRRGG